MKPDQGKKPHVNTEKESSFKSFTRAKWVDRPIKVGDAFIKNTENEYKSCIIVVDSLDWENRVIIGSVYQKLKNTAIGGIPSEEPFTPYLENLTLDWDRYVQFEEKKRIKMIHVGAIQNDFQPC